MPFPARRGEPTNPRSSVRRAVWVVSLMGLLAASVVVAPAATIAATPGTVKVVISTPDGVPAGVLLGGASQKLAVKPPVGTSTTVPLKLAPGSYRVQPQPLTFENDLYTARVSASVVAVRAGKSTTVWVTFHRPPSAADFRADTVAERSISLAWTAPAGATFRLTRRVIDPVTGRARLGKVVPVSGTSVTDAGLAPGTTYAYGLYTAVDGRWTGPLALTVGTAAPAGSTDAAYVAASDALLAAPDDIGSVTRTGTGVRMTLAAGEAPRLLGSAVVLPPSEILEGGFLGRVQGISADGRTLELVPAGIGEAFDYYSLDVPDFGDLEQAEVSTHEPPAGPAALQADCNTDAPDTAVTYTPSIELDGRLKAEIRSRGMSDLGATLDMTVSARLTGAASIKTSASATCSLALRSYKRQITTVPVPLSLILKPVAQVSLTGELAISNIGVTAVAGVSVRGSLTLDGADFNAERILDAAPLTPVIESNGTVGLKLGGELVLGPGAVSDLAGAMAGLKGELGILEAEFAPAYSPSDPGFDWCLEGRLGGSIDLGFSAAAWVGPWDVEHEVELAELSGEWDYLEPLRMPTGCGGAPPSEAVLGSGVELVEEGTGGHERQVGRIPGLVTGGLSSWVISTGDVIDLQGAPAERAASNMGGPGDEYFATLPFADIWHDAAHYEVVVVPSGDTLHVRYVFASEEYPEDVYRYDWVPWSRNAMAILIDGENCATVPGTDLRVSANTINHLDNTQYYIDNSAGAYPTAMDGLTVPLTCSTSVTPGEPVTVRVIVADWMNRRDTAVALVDRGIWSD